MAGQSLRSVVEHFCHPKGKMEDERLWGGCCIITPGSKVNHSSLAVKMQRGKGIGKERNGNNARLARSSEEEEEV